MQEEGAMFGEGEYGNAMSLYGITEVMKHRHATWQTDLL